ncbi:MAG: DcaP family trimeric outer membrane transporter [Burkholderiaceae bacterium]
MRLRSQRSVLPVVFVAAVGAAVPLAAAAQSSGTTIKLGNSGATATLGGYIKLDAIYSIDQDTGDTQDPTALVIPDNQAGDKTFRFHARQTRLFLRTEKSTPIGDLKTNLEGDFFGAGGNEVFSNSRTFRIRHAYGSIGGFGAGQTWTNFMQFTAYPSTVDFNGPMGTSFLRQAQVRYTVKSADGTEWSVSLENPEATGFANPKDRFPDVTGRVKWQGDRWGLEASAVARFLEYETPTASDTTTGYGVMVSGRYRFADTTLMGNVVGGDGIGRYLYPAFGAASGTGIGEARIRADGSLDAIKAWGGQVAIMQQWTRIFSSVLSYGRTTGDAPEAISTRKLESAHFANFWKPIPEVTFGAELSWQRKTLQSSASADAKRIQFSAQYNF